METIHNVKKGVSRLYCSPTDLDDRQKIDGTPVPYPAAGQHYQRLFDGYLRDLAEVFPIADEWWTSLVDAQEVDGLSRSEAIEEAFDKRLAGPAAASEVVSLIRRTWLACAEINVRSAESERVPPAVLLLGWLVDREEEPLVRLLTCMPYWPIGLDENGNWC
jgi:hypothetical protein